MQPPFHELTAPEVLERAPFGVSLLCDGRLVWVNRRLGDWLGTRPAALAGATAGTVDRTLAFLFDTTEEVTLYREAGELHLRRHRGTLANGHAVHFFEDVTERVSLERERNAYRERAQSLETLDPETGLLNRRAILQALDTHLARSRRYGNPVAVVRLNIRPNRADAAASVKPLILELRAQLRWADQVGRLDTQTFLLILPETLHTDAEGLAARLVSEPVPLIQSGDWRIDCAVTGWEPGDDSRKLLQRLDSLSTTEG
jgi:GGDEF domain-containing protein